jgi:putative SOS response-associated peptidase YedK
MRNIRPRYNAAPSQELLVIRQNHKTGERSLDLIKWGLIPYWCQDPSGGSKPINAKAESVAKLPMFRDAYAQRRCIVPVDGFFEWRAIKGARAKQPYAIAMKDGLPFGLAGLWENWRNPKTKSGNAPLPVPGAGRDYHRYVQPKSEQLQKQSQAGNSQTNDPYWRPCHITSAGYNSCD